MPKKIFFVDDEPLIRKAIAQSLEQVTADIHCFSGGIACLEAIENFGCDLLITDINMPEMNGIEVITKARTLLPNLSVIAITGYGDVPLAVSAMKAGAIDFIEKPIDESVLLSAVQRAFGEHDERQKELDTLTAAERKVLSLIVAGHTNREIAEQLQRSTRTVENHRHRLSKKLQASTTADLVRIALQMGISPPK